MINFYFLNQVNGKQIQMTLSQAKKTLKDLKATGFKVQTDWHSARRVLILCTGRDFQRIAVSTKPHRDALLTYDATKRAA